jgi:hypothetical protein
VTLSDLCRWCAFGGRQLTDRDGITNKPRGRLIMAPRPTFYFIGDKWALKENSFLSGLVEMAVFVH